MKYWKEHDFTDIKYTITNTNKKREYLNLECAFDIETTSAMVEERKTAFMYIWAIGIGHGNEIYYGRTWGGFQKFIESISEHFELSPKRRLVVYVHNLSYEFQFIRKYFNWESTFNLEERKPLTALIDLGIELRDSYLLSGYSLEALANNLTKHKIKKLVGDLDYSKVRTYKTPLTDTEMGYVKNDILVITAYINEQLEVYGDMGKIPLTNTSRVRGFVRDECYYTNTDHRKSCKWKYGRYRTLMESLTLDVKDYYLLKKAFQGGYTHANSNYVGEVLYDITGIDFISAYPGVMLAEEFPMGKGIETTIKTKEEFDFYLNEYALLFEARFTGLKSKIKQEHYLSESKCEDLENQVVDNGRIYKADSLTTTITDVDYKVMVQAYDWEDMKIRNVIRYPKGHLPKSIILAILDLYQDKTELQGVKGMETEYNHSKGMLNSVYGMAATDIIRATISYKDSWETEMPLVKEQLTAYNESKNRFLYYPWGVWITAYARRNLWTGILAFGDDYVYSDTDGIKLMNYEKHEGYIEAYNTINRRKLEYMCDINKIDPSRIAPKNIKGEEQVIGNWDIDGYYRRFKTLGAKRYMVQEGDDIELTVAGVGKRSAKDYMLKESDYDIHKVFDMFNDELYIPKEYSGKMTHTYIDEEQTFTITDYLGEEAFIETKSGIHLEEVEFSLSIADQYKDFMVNLQRGYLFKGVKKFNV